MIRRIHHVGIVVTRLGDAYRFYRDVLGLPVMREADIPDQGVRAALLSAGDTEIELLEPRGGGTGIARFLAKRGEGLHHVCFETPAVDDALSELHARGVELLDRVSRPGLAGRIGFLHPRACDGVLVELVTPPDGHPEPASSPLRLKRLVIGARDPAATALRFQTLFGFDELQINGGPRSMLAVGRGALLIVPSTEVGNTEGMVALSLVTDAFPELADGLAGVHARVLRGTGELTVDPASSHGVHLHISRYE